MNSSAGLTGILSDFICETQYDQIPEEVILRAKSCLLDWIGSAYAGIGYPSGSIVYDLVKEMAGAKIAALIGSGSSAPPTEAAFYNGVISSVMEIDDVHEEASLHPGIVVIPAALAVAEYARSSGKELLASIVMGYDISARIARAAGPSHYQFFHTTGTCNTFGAAAAASKLLGLDRTRLTMALGLSGTLASGLWESLNGEATMAKHLHSGKASSTGILSAFLAKQGFKGSQRIIEGEKGFLASLSKATEQDQVRLAENFGKPFLLMRNFFKRHACCRACFEGIEGIQHLLISRHLSPVDIERITVTMKPMRTWLVANEAPKDIFEAKFSLPFCMALMIVRGETGLFQFNEKNLYEPRIREMMKKVNFVRDPETVPKARIEVITRDQSVWTEEPVSQSLNVQEVKEKFVKNMEPLLDENRINAILSSVEHIEAMENVRDLTALLKQEVTRRV